jgi:hypothetical protein
MAGEAFAARRVAPDSGEVKIYQSRNFTGRKQFLKVGKYRAEELRIGNDRLSSIQVAKGYKVTLFEHDDFIGRRKVFTENTSSVGSDFDDRTSSIIVERVAQPRKQPQPRPQPRPGRSRR